MASKRGTINDDFGAATSFMNTSAPAASTADEDAPRQQDYSPIRQITRTISAGEVVPDGYKVVIQEKRNQRIQFIMTATERERMTRYCKDHGVSMSEFINRAITAALDEG